MATNNTYLKVILSATDKITPVFKKLNRLSKLTTKSFRDIGRAGSQITKAVSFAGIAALGGAFAGLKKVIDVGAEFEKFQTILETVEGSSEKARKSMSWVSDFAVKTPYELAEVTDAFVKLKTYGIDPQAGALSAAGDAAAAMGKTLEESVEALADAMTGENERLKTFGITTKRQGDKILYNYTKNGKQMTKVANKNSRAQIEAVINGIWNEQFGGAMVKLSKTYGGLLSNLSDVWARFLLKISDAGIFDVLKGKISGLLTKFDEWQASGQLDVIAKKISGALVSMVDSFSKFISEINWSVFVDDVKSLASSVSSLVKSLGGLKNIAIGLGVALAAGPIASIMSIVGALFRFGSGALAILGGPVTLAIAAIAAGAFLIFKNWDKVSPVFNKLGGVLGGVFSDLGAQLKELYNILAPILMPILKVLGTVLLAGVVGAVYALGKGLQFLVGAITKVVKPLTTMLQLGKQAFGFVADSFGSGSVNVNPTQRTNILGAGNQKVNGEFNVKFENAPPGMRVDQGKTNQSGVKLNADVGYRSFNGYAL